LIAAKPACTFWTRTLLIEASMRVEPDDGKVIPAPVVLRMVELRT
jgi:hypothetical protein